MQEGREAGWGMSNEMDCTKLSREMRDLLHQLFCRCFGANRVDVEA